MTSTDQGSEKDDEQQQVASTESTTEEKQTSEPDTASAVEPPEEAASNKESTAEGVKDRTKVNKAWFELHKEKQEAENKAKAAEEKAHKFEKKEEVRKLIISNPQVLMTYDQNPNHPDTQVANELLAEGDPYVISAYNSVFKQNLPMNPQNNEKSEESSGKYMTREDFEKEKKQESFSQAVKTIRADYPEMTDKDEEEIILKLGGEKIVDFMALDGFETAFEAAARKRFGEKRKVQETKEKEMESQQHNTTSTADPDKPVKVPTEHKQAYQDTVAAFRAAGDTPPSEEEWMSANGLL